MALTIKSMLLVQVAVVLASGNAELLAAEPPSVAYRLRQTKTVHFDDAGKAQLHLETVRKLGCEAVMDSHGGHMDVSYRLTSWKALTLVSDQTAHQWEDWMKKSGFETLHAHGEDHDHSGLNQTGADHAGHNHGTAGTSAPGARPLASGHFHGDGHNHGAVGGDAHAVQEVVSYSLSNWSTTHARDQRESDEVVAILRGLGCEVKEERHDGHADVIFRCARPMHLELPSHQVALGWENWLQKTGFRTQHMH